MAIREIRARKNPAFNAICFHAQQCIEKYLKAVMCRASKPPARTHDLDVLLSDCLEYFPLWEAMRADLKRLSRYAVQFRYPGESASREEALWAVRTMKYCRADIRTALGLHDASRAGGKTRGSRKL